MPNKKFYASSKKEDHYTPPYIMEPVRRFLGGIDLDPASCEVANRTVHAERYYTKADNGLQMEWNARSLWLNPPGGLKDRRSNQDIWLTKLITEVNAGRVEHAVGLFTASTADRWFQRIWDYPKVFVTGRINFLDETGRKQRYGDTKSRVLVYFHRERGGDGEKLAPGVYYSETGVLFIGSGSKREFFKECMAEIGVYVP